MTTWSWTTLSTVSRKDTAVNRTAKKTLPVTSWNPTTTLKIGWATFSIISTMKPTVETCSSTITKWAQTVTCSADIDRSIASLLRAFPKGKALFRLNFNSFGMMFALCLNHSQINFMQIFTY